MPKNRKRRESYDRDVANAAIEAAMEVIDEATEHDDIDSIHHVMMLVALEFASEAAAETLVDKELDRLTKRKKHISAREYDQLFDQVSDKVDRLPNERLWKLFMELMGETLARKTKGRYRVQIIEITKPDEKPTFNPRNKPDDEKTDPDEDSAEVEE
jgi:hypothetical protein